jgi:hypothetical protein
LLVVPAHVEAGRQRVVLHHRRPRHHGSEREASLSQRSETFLN